MGERSYRQKFSNAYKCLLKENGGIESLSYLNEFLDSAQENFPHLWVNGEKYVFSDDVLQAGTTLFKDFENLKMLTSQLMEQVNSDSLGFDETELEMKELLQKFD